MRGHVRKRGNAWYVVVDLPRSIDGKRQQKWHSGFRNKRDADKAVTEILSRLDQGTYVVPTRQTLAEFLDEWLAATKPTIRPSTYATYESLVRTQVNPHIGSVPLQTLNAGRLNAFYAELLASGRRDGKGGLAPRSVRYVHAILRKALQDAVRWNLLQRNVADAADPPRAEGGKATTWSAREVRAFLEHVKGDRLYAAYVLACTTGMRRGEVVGLRWQDVDLDSGRVSVSQTLVVVGGYNVQVSEPKTARGRRSVALDRTTVAAIRSHKAAQLVERSVMGEAYADADLVFCREDGASLHPDLFSDAFWRHAKAAQLPRIRFHDLRHTHATLALAAGIHPKVVSERLGHASITITLDTYSHAIPAMQETAASLVASLVFDED